MSFLLKMAESLRFEIERAAIRDPDDPAVIAAQDRVRAELAALCCLARVEHVASSCDAFCRVEASMRTG